MSGVPDPHGVSDALMAALAGAARGLGALEAERLAPRLGDLLARLAPARRRIVAKNLAIAFPSLTPVEREAVERRIYAHLALGLLDLLRAPRSLAEAELDLDGEAELDRALAQGRGALAVTGHLGSFELAAGLLKRRRPDLEIALVVRPIEGAFGRWVFATRRAAGLQLLPERRGAFAALAALRRGALVVFLVDQHAPPRRAAELPFFGRPVHVSVGPALLARRSGAAVLPVAIARDGRRHSIRFGPPLSAPTPLGLAAAYTAFVEACVRARPESWLWTHDRFKPPTTPRWPANDAVR